MEDAVDLENTVHEAMEDAETISTLAVQDRDIEDAAADDNADDCWGDDGFGDFAEADDTTMSSEMNDEPKDRAGSDNGAAAGAFTKPISATTQDILSLNKEAFQASAATALHKFLPGGRIYTPSADKLHTLKDLESLYASSSLARPIIKDAAAIKLSISHWKGSASEARLLFRLNLGPQPTAIDEIPALAARPSSRQKLLPVPIAAPQADRMPPVKLAAPPRAQPRAVIPEAPSLLKTAVPAPSPSPSSVEVESNGIHAGALPLPVVIGAAPMVVDLLSSPEEESQKEEEVEEEEVVPKVEGVEAINEDFMSFDDESNSVDENAAACAPAAEEPEQAEEVIEVEALESINAPLEDEEEDDFGDFAELDEVASQESEIQETLPAVEVVDEEKEDIQIQQEEDANIHTDVEEEAEAEDFNPFTSAESEVEVLENREEQPPIEVDPTQDGDGNADGFNACIVDTTQDAENEEDEDGFEEFVSSQEETNIAEVSIENGALPVEKNALELVEEKEEPEIQTAVSGAASIPFEEEEEAPPAIVEKDSEDWQNSFESAPPVDHAEAATTPATVPDIPDSVQETAFAAAAEEEEAAATMDLNKPASPQQNGELVEIQPPVQVQEFDDDDFDDFCEAPASVPEDAINNNGNNNGGEHVTATAAAEVSVADAFVAKLPDLSFMLSDELTKPS